MTFRSKRKIRDSSNIPVWARQIKKLRKSKNLKQADIAKVLHCRQATYSLYELGERKIPIEKLIILARYYHVSMDYIADIQNQD